MRDTDEETLGRAIGQAVAMLIAEIAPPLAQLIGEGLRATVLRIRDMQAPPDPHLWVDAIILGVAEAHPEWSGTEKRAYVRDAIGQYIEDHGGVRDALAIDALIQLRLPALLPG